MELGKKIKQLRCRASLTQEQLAERLGISSQSVSKWENAVAMPDVTLLPLIAETFGVSIDDLFDLSVEQRFNRIENRTDFEEEFPAEAYLEYEEFLKSKLPEPRYKKRATELLALLYWHRMNAYGLKAAPYAKELIRMAPDDKNNADYFLTGAAGHMIWDWNFANHLAAIEFYREVVQANPESPRPMMYLIENLLADHRADEAEQILNRLCAVNRDKPFMNQVYRAYIALARFDAPAADAIIEELVAVNPEHDGVLFEAAKYYARKCEYDRAIELYERSHACDPKRPRYQDALQSIMQIYRICGDYRKAAETCERIIDLLQNEWKLSEEELGMKEARAKKAELLAKL